MAGIGFAGVGLMGEPMCSNLLKAGHELRVFDIAAEEALGRLEKQGAKRAGSLGEVAGDADFCITMLPGPAEVEKVTLGTDGLLASAARGTVLIDMSTSSSTLAQRIASEAAGKGVGAVDAPVSGGDVGAKNGTLSVMAGGEAEHVEAAHPIIQAMASTVTHIGPPGSGQICKAINQIIVGIVMAAVSEGFVLGKKAGVNLERVFEAVRAGLAGNQVLEIKGPGMIRGEFKPGAFLRYHLKDLELALEAAKSLGASLPYTSLTRDFFRSAVAQGRSEIDHSGIMTVIEDLNGIKDELT
jgi:3-hydroxyisobutyrate dehydrogenase-like beta-hydroxyacid dehydrogenase